MAKDETTDTLLTQNNTDEADDQTTDDQKTDDQKTDDQDDQKTDDQKTDDQKDEDDKTDDKPEGAPEEYAEFTLPEGMEVDQVLMDDFKPLAKELNLTQEQAQKLVDLQAKNVQDVVDAQVDAFVKIKEGWVDEVKADKEIGGADYKENLSVAIKAIDKFGSDEFRKLLDESGFGSHPEMVRCFYHIGKAISEDKFVEGDKKADEKPFYDKSDHK